VDFGGLFFLALVWVLFKLVSKSRDPSAAARPSSGSRSGLGPLNDPPREEGRALRMLLQELERATQGTTGRAARPPVRGLPSTSLAKDGRSLEPTDRVESLEGVPLRGERVDVDQDEEAEQVIARRSAAAAARWAPRGTADHRQSDQRARQDPADHPASRSLTPQQLRDAMIWREILGPPVAERDR
jgi:hypothetical protein